MNYKCATSTLMEINLALSLTSAANRSCKQFLENVNPGSLLDQAWTKSLFAHMLTTVTFQVWVLSREASCANLHLMNYHYLEKLTL